MILLFSLRLIRILCSYEMISKCINLTLEITEVKQIALAESEVQDVLTELHCFCLSP